MEANIRFYGVYMIDEEIKKTRVELTTKKNLGESLVFKVELNSFLYLIFYFETERSFEYFCFQALYVNINTIT